MKQSTTASAKKTPVAKAATTARKSRTSPSVVASSPKKFASPIDHVFGSIPSNNNNTYRRRKADESSHSNYIVTKTKYKRLPDHSQPPPHRPNHHQHRRQQQPPPVAPPPRKQLYTGPPRSSHFERYEHHGSSSSSKGRYNNHNNNSNSYSLKRQRPHQSNNSYQNNHPSSSSSATTKSSSSAATSKFYETKLPDLQRISQKEKEIQKSQATFPCWMKSSRTSTPSSDPATNAKTNTDNSSNKKLSPSRNGGGGGKSIQDIIHHIRNSSTNDEDRDEDCYYYYNVEMNRLAQYIQLRPHEIQLRNQFVSQLEEQIIQQLLPLVGGNKNHNNNNNNHHPKYCHVFGSFASIPICTFQSDLDIALFNVGIEGNYKTAAAPSSTATNLNDNNNSGKIASAPKEVIMIDDDDDDNAEVLPPVVGPRGTLAPVATTTEAIPTKQQRKAILVAKWKLALEQSTGSTTTTTTTSTTAACNTKAATTTTSSTCDNVINIFDDSDFDTASSDNDSADPMKGFQELEDDDDDDDVGEDEYEKNNDDKRGRKRAYSDSTILSINSQNDEAASEKPRDDPSMTVSFFASKPPPSVSTTIGPQGHVRIKVVSMLATLSNKLRKKSITRSMQIENLTFIKTARVPIIKIQLVSGFNVDIAVGGYGTDTSLYAAHQIQLYPNVFVPVVVFLKVLLAQHNLDEPYTGGLGSYKLYILIADHIYRHQEWCRDHKNGCSDSSDHMGPFEVLFTFLYRYGYGDMQGRQVLQYPTTALHQHRPVVSAHDTTTCADLSNVYKIQECVILFRLCFHRLYQRILIQQQGKSSSSSSVLAHVICPFQLQSSRERMLQQTQKYASSSTTTSTTVASSATHTTTSDTAGTRSSSSTRSSKNLPEQDRTRDEIIAGYERVFC